MKNNVLVAIMNNLNDFRIAKDKHWYRIPVSSAKRMLKHVWPPEWLAFYHTKVFNEIAYSIRYFSRIRKISIVTRSDLFPENLFLKNADKRYYKLSFNPLSALNQPIYSRRQRRIVFIPTTMKKFSTATEINDLFSGSPLEDKLWASLKQLKIPTQRQKKVTVFHNRYLLDFSLYCARGNIDIETDGDRWHHNPQLAERDNRRNNDLSSSGWYVLRFNSQQINNQMNTYCLPSIVKNINYLGGIETNLQEFRQIELCVTKNNASAEWIQ